MILSRARWSRLQPTSSIPRRRLVRPDGFHVYSVTRRPGLIEFRVDGKLTGVLTRARLHDGQRWVYDKPMFLTLNLAIGGWPGAPTAATPSDARLVIDWIRYRPG